MSTDRKEHIEQLEGRLADRLQMTPEQLAEAMDKYRELMQSTPKITQPGHRRTEWETPSRLSLSARACTHTG